MEDREFLCSLYNKDLVDRAIKESKGFYHEFDAESLYKMAKTAEMLPDRTGAAEIYDTIQREMTYAYLHGVSYAAAEGLTSNDTKPSEETFSDFHKNVDFAVLFNFSDNDFCLAIEAAAKTYCDEFNEMLHQIDVYANEEHVKGMYRQEFEELCKIDNIKEIMKCGFLAQRMQNFAEVCSSKMPNAAAALENIKSDLDYILWDGDKVRWETIDGKYVEVEKFPRFITGTRAEIEEALKKHGEPFKEPYEDQPQEFPVWCNGEVVILYMKNGYLTYLIR